jgi:hypothetical protein
MGHCIVRWRSVKKEEKQKKERKWKVALGRNAQVH